jgi:hypothetical protein
MNQTGTPNGGGGPQWQEVLLQSVVCVFKRWTTVQMAIAQEWAGTETRQHINDIVEEILSERILLNKRKRPMSPDEVSDVEALTEFLSTNLYEHCNCKIEDDSDREVAVVILRLFDTVRRGNFQFAEQVVTAWQAESAQVEAKTKQLAANCLQDDTQYVDENGVNVDEIDADADAVDEADAMQDDDDCAMQTQDDDATIDASGNNASGSASSSASTANNQPQFDDDGFQIVGRRAKR